MRKFNYQQSSIAQSPQIAQFIEEKYGEGHSLRQIEHAVESKFGAHFCPNTIRNYIKSLGGLTKHILEGDSNLKEHIKGRILDVVKQLKEINQRANKIMETAKKDEVKLQAIREIREQLILQERILSKFMEGFNVNQVNKIEFTKMFVNALPELEREGYIRILKNPGNFRST